MKTAGRRTQNRYAIMRSQPSKWGGRLEQILLNYAGWKARKNPTKGEVFFLTSPFIEQILLNYAGWKARKNPTKGEVFFLTSPFIELTGT